MIAAQQMNVDRFLRLLFMRRKLHQHDELSHGQIEDYKKRTLKELRDYAYANSSFYKQFHRGFENLPLEELPVVSKAELMKNWDEIVIDKSLRLDDVRNFLSNISSMKLLNNRYVVASTAGSSGLKGIFVYNLREWNSILASYMRANDWAGVKVGLTKRLKLAIISSTVPWHQSFLVGATLQSYFVPTLRIDSTEPMKQIVSKLNKFQPRSLVAYANMTRALAVEQLDGHLQISPETVFCSSEVLTIEAKRLMRQVWNVEPFNVYAATETAGIASECVNHRLHVYEDFVIVESVDDKYNPVRKGEYGKKILVTVLFSSTLPLIRYEIDDSILLSGNKCSCGLPYMVIDDIQGRVEEILQIPTPKGDVSIQPNFFHTIMETFPIAGWQVIQEKENLLNVLIVKSNYKFREEILAQRVLHELDKLGASPEVHVEQVNSLHRSSLGKTILIKSLQRATFKF